MICGGGFPRSFRRHAPGFGTTASARPDNAIPRLGKTLKRLMKAWSARLRGRGHLVRRRRTIERQTESFNQPPADSPTGYRSQVGQDRFINEQFFQGRRDGVFVDIGAYDGVLFSNSCYFERNLGWTGLCVEPNPAVFARLVKNRACRCANVCVADFNGTAKFLQFADAEMFSGLAHSFSPREKQRIETEVLAGGGRQQELEVPCVAATDLFREHGLSRIDYLSIDTEGMDFTILKVIDLARFDIDVISIENNDFALGYQIMDYLDQRGYDLVGVVGDEIYRRRRSTPGSPPVSEKRG